MLEVIQGANLALRFLLGEVARGGTMAAGASS